MLRAVAGSSLCAVALIGTAGAASAGEITGNGKYKDVNGKSICAFSGQNDGYHDPTHQEGPDDTGRVQSYGQIVRTGALKGSGRHGIPGMTCNPNAEPPQEPVASGPAPPTSGSGTPPHAGQQRTAHEL